jgi:hypothetical protein
VIGVSTRRKRVKPAVLRRDPKAARGHRARPVRAAVGAVGLAGVVVVDGVRLRTSPIVGSGAWWDGTLVGGCVGVAVALLWFRASRGGGVHAIAGGSWWAWATGLGLLVTVFTVHGGRGTPTPPIDSAHRVGALWYDVIAIANVGLLFVPMHFQEIRAAVASRRTERSAVRGKATE